MPTVALTGLGIAFLASTSGIVVSILYLAKKIAANENPMLGIAQSFMLFAVGFPLFPFSLSVLPSS